MDRGGFGLTHVALLVVTLTAGGVYSLHMSEVPPSVAFVIVMSVFALALSAAPRVSSAARVAGAAVVVTFGLVIVASMSHEESRTERVLRNLGWAQAILAAWVMYSAAIANRPMKSAIATYDDESRKAWRRGDLTFGIDLARRIVVSAQPSWAALVLESAWREPRPKVIAEMIETLASASVTEVRTMLERIREKGGTDVADARWELARAACEVVLEARAKEDQGDVGGVAVARLVVAAAKVVRDEEESVRVFAAVVLPAIARRA